VWGEGITPKAIWRIVKAAAGQAGIQNLAPHDLRRYAASWTMPNFAVVGAAVKRGPENSSA